MGLGNPGKKYENTWHNIGFWAIDEFWRENNFPDFTFSKKFTASVSEKKWGNEKIILAKPQTYMNLSGKTAKALADFYKIDLKNLVVVHDDIDLLLGKMKISTDRGSAGHKGVESVFQEIGEKDFVRLRIGISPELKKTRKAQDFVLRKFGKKETKIAKDIVKKANEALKLLITDGLEKAMNKYN
jgi:PTH1 family peptidyl-tRNA hydrolase